MGVFYAPNGVEEPMDCRNKTLSLLALLALLTVPAVSVAEPVEATLTRPPRLTRPVERRLCRSMPRHDVAAEPSVSAYLGTPQQRRDLYRLIESVAWGQNSMQNQRRWSDNLDWSINRRGPQAIRRNRRLQQGMDLDALRAVGVTLRNGEAAKRIAEEVAPTNGKARAQRADAEFFYKDRHQDLIRRKALLRAARKLPQNRAPYLLLESLIKKGVAELDYHEALQSKLSDIGSHSHPSTLRMRVIDDVWTTRIRHGELPDETKPVGEQYRSVIRQLVELLQP
jgi:hypothetical protein